MDGRRHSVDIPISKALVALRRVRSLRDPSTNSMSKFFPSVDGLHWDKNLGNGVDFGFENAAGECHTGRDILTSEDLCLYQPGEEHLEDRDEHHCSKKSKYENSAYVEKSPNGKTYEKYGEDERGLTCFSPSSDCLEGIGSCSGLTEGRLQTENVGHNSARKRSSYKKKHTRSARVAAAGTITRIGSPRLSIGNVALEASNRGNSLFGSEDADVDVVDSNHHGCKIGCCWSRTPRMRGSYISPDVEVQPLLSLEMDASEMRRGSKHVRNELKSYAESQKSISQKFRPKSFSELVGQTMVARSLLNAILNGKISRLYLFHGSRGTGKTSASRIFAAALNCVTSGEDKPCGFCQDCVLSFSGTNMNVKEVDPVRVNRKEKMISLIKNASMPLISSYFRIFIVDDCHLLQGETWVAILNSLEDLSQHVVFIMTTPDLDKLPRSVVARSQRFHFPKIKDVDIANRLGKICVEEGLEFDQAALNFIATKSSGSLRDAEMMLEQLSLLGKTISLSLVYELTGTVSDDELLDLLDLALSSNTANTVRRSRELMQSRIDPMQLISQLANLIMDILAGKFMEGSSETRIKFLRRHNAEADMQQLSRALKILSETEKQLRASKHQKTWLTVALLQLSSMNFSSLDSKDSRLDEETLPSGDGGLCSILPSCENLRQLVACTCNNKAACGFGVLENMEMLVSLWTRAIDACKSSSLRRFLRRRGKLAFVSFNQGYAIVILEFRCPDHVSRAEKSWKLIASALQFTLGCNIEIRMDLVHDSDTKKYTKLKKPSFSLFSCSRRTYESLSTAKHGSDLSECSCFTSGKAITENKSGKTCPSECGSHISGTCSQIIEEARIVNSSDGNALSIRSNQAQRLLPAMLKQHGLGAYHSKNGVNSGCHAVSPQHSENHSRSCSQSINVYKKLPKDASPVISSNDQQPNRAVSLLPTKKHPIPNLCSCKCYGLRSSSNIPNNCPGDEDGTMEFSKLNCWRTSTFPFRKAWKLRHQSRRAPLVGWVLRCATTS